MVKRVTLWGLPPADLFKRLSAPGRESHILGQIICATYWGGSRELDLQQLELLSAPNWKLAVEIMGYRRSAHWSEAQFHAVARWCREHFELVQWDDE